MLLNWLFRIPTSQKVFTEANTQNKVDPNIIVTSIVNIFVRGHLCLWKDVTNETIAYL